METLNKKREELQNKIKQFVKKYYLNELNKGIIFFILIVLSSFIAFSLFEHFSYSNTIVRTILFYSFITLFVVNFVLYIIIPLFKLLGLGKQLSQQQIAAIVGKHFKEIDDKLLNLFELQNKLTQGDYKSYDLLLAAIDSKIDAFSSFSFIQAIPIKKTIRFSRWLLLPFSIFLFIFLIKSEVFTESTKRIVHYTTVYEKPAPYSFEILNNKLRAFQHDDYTIKVRVVGEETPNELFVKYENRSYKCVKESNTEFSYTFTNIQKNIDFQFITDEVQSSFYTLDVLPKPVTLGFEVHLHYPSYINKPDEVIENIGNVTVPEGTVIKWYFYTRNSDNLVFIANDKIFDLESKEEDKFTVLVNARSSFIYSVINTNRYFTSEDTLTDEVNVIKDLYPEIYVQSQQDSNYQDRIYFKGNIKDDYGFSKLEFVYSKYDDKGKCIASSVKDNIPIKSGVTIQDFYYYFDPNTIKLQPGEKIDYFFQVYDNDGVNGNKMSKSSVSSYRLRTMDEIDKDLDNSEKQTKSDYNFLIKESSQLMKDIEKLQLQMMQEKELNWQDKKKLENLLEQYKKLEQQVNALKHREQNRQNIENQYKDIDKDIIEKQKELQKRMDQVLSDEMKQMMNKLQDLMKTMNKEQVQNQMKKMKTSTEDINKALDQQLQLYKQLELEKKVNETVQALRDLADQMNKNASKTNDKSISKESLLKEQKRIEEKFNEVKEDIQNINQLNKQLEDPTSFKNTEDLQNNVSQQIQESKQNIEKNNRPKSSQNQRNAAEDMEKIADQINQDFNQSELEQVSEDIETMRQLLDNLVKISFNQEVILNSTKGLKSGSAAVSQVITKQFNVQNDMKLIEDSLNALARRQLAVKPFIQKEVSKIQEHLNNSRTRLQDRQLSQASRDQQFVLTSMNNLALMLKESMKEMQKKQSECKSKCNKSGNGSCNKSGNSGKKKSKKTSARELQQQLNRQMEALKRSAQQNGQKQGSSGNQQQMSEQFAKMAAQQEAIRKMLEDYDNGLKSENGVGDKTIEQLIEEMKKTEKELVNRTITQQTIQRLESITTRLLQSERADLQREKEEERKSTEALEVPHLNPPKNWNFDRDKHQQNEMLRSVPANLNYYYKDKANHYFYNID